MVYRAAEKQTNEYIIASKEEKATMMNNESFATTNDDTKTVSTKPFFAAVVTKDSPIQKTAHDNNDDKTKSTGVINDSPKPFFGAVIGSNDIDESIRKKKLTQMDTSSTDDKSNAYTVLSVAGATDTDDNNKKKKEEVTMKLGSTIMANDIPITSTTTVAVAINHAGTTPTIPTNGDVERSSLSSSSPNVPSSSTLSSSSLLRSGGRMLWKFVGDGLQMVAQQVVSSSSSSSSEKGK